MWGGGPEKGKTHAKVINLETLRQVKWKLKLASNWTHRWTLFCSAVFSYKSKIQMQK